MRYKENPFHQEFGKLVQPASGAGFGDGGNIDIHKLIGKLPKPKAGWTPGKYKYMGPYNPLEKQLDYDPETGEVLRWYVKPYNKVDEIAANHDICYYRVKTGKTNKGDCDRQMVKELDKIPYGEMPKWGQTARFLINTKQKTWVGGKKRKKPSSKWQEKLADELHKPIRRKFTRRRVIVNGIDEIWCSDLVEMGKLSKWNKGYRYLLMVLDVFSKYGWIVPLKDKKGESVAKTFKTIFKEGRKPHYLWTDKGKEYYNKNMKELLDKNKINIYSTENEEKSSVCERWNRTMKNKMWKQFTVQNNTMYLDMLPKLVAEYNNTKHRSIGMTPVEASKKKNEGDVYINLYGKMKRTLTKPKFQVGDKVRISKYKRPIFDKGYAPNWTEEIFTVDAILYTNPITYKMKDELGEEITGSFYEPELQKAVQDVYRIEKVIRRDARKGKALVKWSGYPEKFNSWVDLKDLR